MRSGTTRKTIGAILGGLLGGVLLIVPGCVMGAAIGWQRAYFERDGASEVVYDASADRASPQDFWIVAYDGNDPRLMLLGRDNPALPLFSLAPPSTRGPHEVGPWESEMPQGIHTFVRGGVRYNDHGRDWSVAALTLVPSNPEHGWVRQIYEYEIRDGAVTPLRVTRERASNDEGAQTVVAATALGGLAGTGMGMLLGASLGMGIARKSLGTTAQNTHATPARCSS